VIVAFLPFATSVTGARGRGFPWFGVPTSGGWGRVERAGVVTRERTGGRVPPLRQALSSSRPLRSTLPRSSGSPPVTEGLRSP
jgi:hypothetical protein